MTDQTEQTEPTPNKIKSIMIRNPMRDADNKSKEWQYHTIKSTTHQEYLIESQKIIDSLHYDAVEYREIR